MPTSTTCTRISSRSNSRPARRLAAAAPFALAVCVLAQSVDPASLLHPGADSWPTYHGDYTGRRHSPLTDVTPDNVSRLGLAWAFQTNRTDQLKGSPIVVNGVLYVTAPDHIWAIDARSGREIWHYAYPENKGFHIGHRGAAVYRDLVYLTTPDAYLVALDAKDGTLRWKVQIADATRGYWCTMAPLLIRNHLLVGVSGDFDNLPGLLQSFDPETGKVQWTFHSTGGQDAKAPADRAMGGQMWMTGTYDPDLNLAYWGTGNPTPVLNGGARPGNNLYTGSILALNPDTGKLAWAFQATPHDTHDWDASEVPVLVDGTFRGAPVKMLMQASRNGYFFVLDRATGASLLTRPFGPVNWATGIDGRGQPIPNPAKEPARDGRLVAPNESGLTNYRSPSVDVDAGLFIVSAHDSYGMYFFKPEDGGYGWAGADYNIWGRGILKAIDYQTGATKWTHDLSGGDAGAGVLTTAAGLLFTGDSAGNAIALRTRDGATLWHTRIGRVGTAPVTYELDGRQFVVIGGGPSLFAFALPQ